MNAQERRDIYRITKALLCSAEIRLWMHETKLHVPDEISEAFSTLSDLLIEMGDERILYK